MSTIYVTEGELAQIAANLHDGVELTLDECRHLVAEVRRLRRALVDVCCPMQYVLRGYSPEARRHVNSILLVRLCDSIPFVQDIARKALGDVWESERQIG